MSSVAWFSPAAPVSKKPRPVFAALAGAHIETLGATMQVEATRLYRVRAVAEALDVSVATIYRAVESGALRAVRMGTGKGAVRIPGQAIEDYIAACERAAATRPATAPTEPDSNDVAGALRPQPFAVSVGGAA